MLVWRVCCAVCGRRPPSLYVCLTNPLRSSSPPPLLFFDSAKQRQAGLLKLLADFDTPSSKKTSAVQNESDLYESNSARLLVKALYNCGSGVSISSTFQYLEHCHVAIPGSDLTPDFQARVRYPTTTPMFPSCLVSTLSTNPPTIDTTELASPPPSPDSSSSAAASSPPPPPHVLSALSHVVFEFSLDHNLWLGKLAKLERYASAILSNTKSPPCLAGLGFVTNKKFRAIQETLKADKGKAYPTLWNLHLEGRLLVLVCDRSFVTSTFSDISSQSGEINSLKSLVVGLVRVLASDGVDSV